MAEQQLDHAQAKEIINFQISYNKQRMKATWALACVIVGIYLLEDYWGGSTNIAVLVRMGANVPERVLKGEYYRLFSSVFLHAGFLHVFFNTYVLFALGGFFNRILGESKYLTVFLVSGVCGSLSSVLLGKSNVSVGASGAIWGLFGVSLALAIFKTSLLPEAIRLRLRRVTFINLIINLGISFLPMIDFWAHIGGGIGGFLISLLIIFRPKSPALNQLSIYGFRVLACVLSLIYVANIAYGLWLFKPWVNQLHTELHTVDLAPLPFAIAVPVGLKENVGPHNTSTSAYFSFGNPQIDRVVLEVHFFHEAILGQAAGRDWLIAQRDQLLKEALVPASVKKTIFFRESLHGGELYYQQTPKNGDTVIHNYVITKDKYAIKIGLVVAYKIEQSEADRFVNNVIESIRSQ